MLTVSPLAKLPEVMVCTTFAVVLPSVRVMPPGATLPSACATEMVGEPVEVPGVAGDVVTP